MSHFSIKVPEYACGMRLDRHLMQTYPHLGYHQIQKYIREKKVRINGLRAKPCDLLMQTDELSFHHAAFLDETKTYRPLSGAWKEKIKSWLLYEDEHIFVLNKPADLACQGGSGQRISLDELMKRYSDQQFRLVHRLDKPTTGILIFAKNLKSAQRLSEQFHERSIEKVYWALVHGVPAPSRGRIATPIVVDDKETQAVTFYQIQKQFEHPEQGILSFVHLLPRTGRKHQLRIHMAQKGHPILGDTTYGGASFAEQKNSAESLLFLHCHQITLPSGLQIKAPLPEYFLRQVHGFMDRSDC